MDRPVCLGVEINGCVLAGSPPVDAANDLDTQLAQVAGGLSSDTYCIHKKAQQVDWNHLEASEVMDAAVHPLLCKERGDEHLHKDRIAANGGNVVRLGRILRFDTGQ
jgi:hypothetical protein